MSAPWFKCYPRDFNEGMVGLTLEERGAYITILNLIYARSGPIPEDVWWITSQLDCTARAWTRLRASLIVKRKLFPVAIGGEPHLMNPRADAEIAERQKVSEKFSEAGSRGGRNSQSKRNKNNGSVEARLEPGLSLDQAISDTETDIPPTPLEGGAGSGRRKPRKALPENFPTDALIDEQQQKARTAGADLDVSAEAERFRNHALSSDRRCVDWPAAWRNWVLKAIGWAPKTTTFQPPPPDDDPWPRRIREFERNGFWNTTDWGPKPGRPDCKAPQSLLERAA